MFCKYIASRALFLFFILVSASAAKAQDTLQLSSPQQSSITRSGEASRAIDGNTNGRYRNRSVSQTASEFEAWWSAELEGRAEISEITLWNRTDNCCRSRLSDFYVFVSEQPFDPDAGVDEVLNMPGVFSYFNAGTLSGSSVTIPVDASGRYVRIQLSDTNTLSLAEVEVFGTLLPVVEPPQNVEPIAVDDSATLSEGGEATINVLSNDGDPENEPLTVSIATEPGNGSLIVNADSTISYLHDGSETSADSFTYQIADPLGATATATVSLSITAENDQPIAVDDAATVVEGGEITISVLANDSDAEGDALTVSVVTAPANGTLTLSGDSAFVYQHDGSETSADSFTYQIADPLGATATATVSLSITAENDQPIAVDDAATVVEDGEITISVLANDSDVEGDALTVSVVTAPANGTLTLSGDNAFVYQHDGSETSSDSFTYQIADPLGATATATVNLSISAENDQPVAVDDTAIVVAGGEATISVLANDSDAEGDALTVSVVTAPANGTLTLSADNALVYQHDGSDTSSDSFTYQIADPAGATDTAIVAVTVEPAPPGNEAPVALDDMLTLNAGDTETIAVLENDSDADGSLDPSSVVIVDSPVNGTANVQTDGSIIYVHDGSDRAADIFTYSVADEMGETSNIASVNITVNPIVTNSDLNAFHRSGQTFLTWQETGLLDGYHVYRHTSPVTTANLSAATLLTNRWGPLDSDTSVNLYGGPNVPSHFVINTLDTPLDDSAGLFVYTTQEGDSSEAYYAVVPVRNGVELTAVILATDTVLNESVDQPGDVLTVSVNDGKGRNYTQFMDYSNWNPTFNGYIYNYSVALPANYNPGQSYPLAIHPHAFSEPYKFREQTEYDWEIIQLFPNDPGESVNAEQSWWYGYSADHNYKTDGRVPTEGVIENFTEQRVMRAVQEMISVSDVSVNANRVHTYGHSMGGSATLAWNLRYPSILAGGYSSQPMTNYATNPLFQAGLEHIWGSQSSNLPIVNRGPYSEDIQKYGVGGTVDMGVWDWMNHQQQMIDRRGDEFGYIMTSHGKLDTVIDWQTQGKPLLQALTDANVGFSARYRGDFGHQSSQWDSVVLPMFGFGYNEDFAWKYPLDLSFPSITNASGSSAIGPADTGDDFYNQDIHWATPHTPFDTSIVDEINRYEITLKSLSDDQIADITPRRTQRFSITPGQQCNWSTTNRNTNVVIASGSATADSDSLMTIAAVEITSGTGTRLLIDCSGSSPNTSPMAENDTADAIVAGSVVVDVLSNDSDADGVLDAGSVSITQQPSSGSAMVQTDGTIVYAHNGSSATSDSFVYTVSDTLGAVSLPAMVSITISEPPNTAPVATADEFSVAKDGSKNINVLANDIDPDGFVDVATVVIVQMPSQGSATVQNDGSITYVHDGGDVETDDFSYMVRDDDGDLSNVAVVNVAIDLQPNLDPIAGSDTLVVNNGGFNTVMVLLNDNDADGSLDASSVTIGTPPVNGTAVAQDNGSILYTHDGSASTSDSFDYTVADNLGATSNSASVSVTIDELVNVAPQANNDLITVNSGALTTLTILDNDFDSDGSLNVSSVTLVDVPQNGTLNVNENGSVDYTHSGNQSLSDSFSYTVADSQGSVSNIALVSLTISNSNISDLSVLHRSGQTFLTWPESDLQHEYHVYRHIEPITSGNLALAERLTDRWGPLPSNTSVNLFGGSNVPSHYVIEDLGAPLSDSTGLFVYTTQSDDSSNAFYAVASVVGGVEDPSTMLATNTAVEEVVESPSDVLTISSNGGNARIYTQFMDYTNWNPTFNGYIYNYSVALPAGYDQNESYPLMLNPHSSYQEYGFLQESIYGWQVVTLMPSDPGPQVGTHHSWWYGYASDHNYLTEGPIPQSGAIENFTEHRVMRSIQFLSEASDLNIDTQKIHAQGLTMGGSGALAWSMRYPNVISGVWVSEPMTNYSTSPQLQGDFERLWGAQASNLPIVNKGPYSETIQLYGMGGVQPVGVWDWMDHQQQLVDRRGDNFGYIMTSHAKNAYTFIDWQTQGKPLVQSFTDANAGFSSFHRSDETSSNTSFDSVVTPLFGFGGGNNFPWKYPLNLSFPAIQNASASAAIVPDDAGAQTYNLDIEWATPQTPFDTTIVDTQYQYELTLRSTSDAQTADITPRRTQAFAVNPGQECSWTTTDRNTETLIDSGMATADADSLLTIPGVSIVTGIGTRLAIDCN